MKRQEGIGGIRYGGRQAVWFIGAGVAQLARIRSAQSLGLLVVATDIDPFAVGLVKADHPLVLSRDDAEGQCSAAEELRLRHGIEIVAVYSGVSGSEETEAALDGLLGMPSRPFTLDKAWATDVWREAGIPVPDQGDGTIVKPRVGSGAVGVCFYPPEVTPEVPDGHFAQPFVAGRHVDANGFFHHGEFFAGSVSERFLRPGRGWMFDRFEDPADLSDHDYERAQELLRGAAEAIGVRHGPVKIDLIWGRRGPVVLEVETRFHGDVSTCWTSPRTGVDVMSDWLRACRGEALPADRRTRGRGVAGARFIYAPAGCVSSGRAPGVYEVEEGTLVKRLGPGALVPGDGTDARAIAGYVVSSAESRDELRERLPRLIERFGES